MAKIIKKKRKFRLNSFLTFVCVLSGLGYVGSVTVLHAHNVSKNYELIQLNIQNEEAQKKLETLRLEVASYTDREYIMNIVNENGEELTYSQQRVNYISNSEEE